MRGRLTAFLLGTALPLLSGCISLPGKPPAGPEVPRPDSIHSATVLFAQNCSGCHGAKGMDGPAVPLAAPEYQALVDDARIRNVIANGDPGTLMPGFGTKSQGFLTDSQIDALVKGIRAEWYKGNVLAGLNAPPYADDTPGDAAHGLQVYSKVCSQCHGEMGGEVGYAGSILNASFLALMPAQSLRTAIIVGRPDLGMPDWRTLDPDKPLTAADVRDVVALLESRRPARPGQPYAPYAAPAGSAGFAPKQPAAQQRSKGEQP
ncbi:MAG: c-type cytochrome [Acidobacteriaceae bacterium]